MKKTLTEERERIIEIMSQVDESFISPELRQSFDNLLGSLNNNINNIKNILKVNINKEGKLSAWGQVNRIKFLVDVSNTTGEIEGFYLHDEKNNVNGYVKPKYVEPEFDEVINTINDMIYPERINRYLYINHNAMKKTLTEEKKRIFEIMSQVDKSFVSSKKTKEEDIEEQGYRGPDIAPDVQDNYVPPKEGEQTEEEAQEDENDSLELGGETHEVQETDEYNNQYVKNMSIGFKPTEVDEGNAFIAAANKAKESGKDTFELAEKHIT